MKFSDTEWVILSKLLDELLELPAGERQAWLDDRAGPDARFRPVLESLSARLANGEGEDFLNTLPKLSETPGDDSPVLREGDLVGPYRLCRELGVGGMGQVWLAERADGILKRPVALKLPHLGMRHGRLRERFGRERDILAAMTHPQIARLYDAGVTGDGQPYLALEYVEGTTLTQYCDEARLGLRPRLQLFLQVLGAVQYAHSHLVIHRDLKPSNILVTPEGQVKLLDFGIAKLLTDGEAKETELTQFGFRALTPDYASPEQISGEPVSTASDVYSLGLVLYELLAGERPYNLKRNAPGGLAEAILHTEPGRPSHAVRDEAKASARSTTPKKLAAALKGDLDTIVLKALHKQPAGRYRTADALAEDIGRYLAGEPVLALPESAWYRARKFVARHRWAVASAACVFLALGTGLGAALWEARIAAREARTAVAVQHFLENIFQANSTHQPDPVKARQTTARELLDIGAQRIDIELKDTPFAKLSVLETLARMYWELGLDDQAVALDRTCVSLAKSLYGNRGLPVAAALGRLAGALHASRFVNEREGVLAEAQGILDARGDFTSETRALVLEKLAEHYQSTDLTKAAGFAGKAVELYRRLPRSPSLVDALYMEGLVRSAREEYREAAPLFSEAISLSKILEGDPNPVLPRMYAYTGETQWRLGNYNQAEKSLRSALEVARAVKGEEHVDTFETELRLGMFLVQTSRMAEGLKYLENARRLIEKMKGLSDPFYAPKALAEYGRALAERGRIKEGLDNISQAADNRRKNRPGTLFLAQILEYQASALIELGSYVEARKLLDEAAAIEGKFGAKHGLSEIELRARLLTATGRANEVAGLFDGYSSGKATALPLESLRILEARAAAAVAMRDGGAAVNYAGRAAQQIAADPARPYLRIHEASAALLEGRGRLLMRRPAQALLPLKQAVALRSELLDPVSPALEDARIALAECYRDLGDTRQAAALYSPSGGSSQR